MGNFTNLMMYGGLDKERYVLITDSIWESSRKSLRTYSIITLIGMGALLILSFFRPVLESSRTLYVVCIILGAAMLAITMGPARTRPMLTRVAVGVFSSILLIFGMLLGTFVEPNQASASFGILIFAVPLLFLEVPFLTDLQIVISLIVYIIFAKATQTPDMFSFNMSFIIPYGIVSLILSAVIMKEKIQRHYLIYENQTLSEKDYLTGLANRRCFEQKILQLDGMGCEEGTLLCAFDVNGLKSVNDTLGHRAGDELLRGAADCICNVFGNYGECYRIGGDEFFAIIEGAAPKTEELEEAFKHTTMEFNGTLVSELSVSLGIVEYKKGEDINDAIHAADKKMYQAKATHYEQAADDI